MTPRKLIVALSIALLPVAIAGCSGSDSGEDGGDETGPNKDVWFADPLFSPDLTVGQNCSGSTYESSGQVTFDLSPIEVSGTATLNGEPFPEGGIFGDNAGTLRFEQANGEAITQVTLSRQNDQATFQVDLQPGQYDIYYQPPSGSCDNSDYPCLGGRIVSDANLRDESSLQLDVETAQLTGVVTIDDTRMPEADSNRGNLQITSRTGTTTSLELGESGVADYQINLVTGSYDIDWIPGEQLCAENPDGPIPCSSSQLAQNLGVGQTETRSFDLSPITVQGTVTVNNQTLPDADSTRGRVIFKPENGPGAATRPLGESGQATYSMTLLAKEYDIYWAPPEELCGETPTPGVPCVSGTIQSDVSLRSDGSLNLDVPMIEVSGNVSLGSGDPPQTEDRWGFVAFLSRDVRFQSFTGISTTAFGFSISSENTDYSVSIMPGNYDVAWANSEEQCPRDAQNIPCMPGPLRRDVNLQSSGSLDVTLPSVRLSGQLTLADSSWPDTSTSRGQLLLVHEVGTSVSSGTLGSSGPATFERTVFPGTYDIAWVPNDASCGDESNGAIPCNQGFIERDVQVSSSGQINLSMSSVSLSGLVTLNEGSLPDFDQNRGRILFRNDASRFNAGSLGSNGTAPFDATLLEDDYVVVFEGNSDLCDAPQTMPCGFQVLDGC